MSKKTVPLNVEIDEIGLSVLGWEIANIEARLIGDEFRDATFYEVAASLELRFHPDDWEIRHDRDEHYLPDVIWQLRSRSKGALSGYQQIDGSFKAKELRAPKLVSGKMDTWETSEGLSPDDLYIWVGGVDWGYFDGWHTKPGSDWDEVPVEIFDYTTLRGVRTEFAELVVRIRDGKTLEVTARTVHPIGTAEELMTAAADYDDWSINPDIPFSEQEEFEVQPPCMSIEVFDSTGFLLDRRECGDGEAITIEDGQIPSRPPTSATAVSFRLDDLAGAPARVVVRLQDAVE